MFTDSGESIPGCVNMLIWLASVDSAPLGCAISSANAGLLSPDRKCQVCRICLSCSSKQKVTWRPHNNWCTDWLFLFEFFCYSHWSSSHKNTLILVQSCNSEHDWQNTTACLIVSAVAQTETKMNNSCRLFALWLFIRASGSAVFISVRHLTSNSSTAAVINPKNNEDRCIRQLWGATWKLQINISWQGCLSCIT